MEVPVDVRYAMNGSARLAYSVRGRGPHRIVFVPAFVSNQDSGYYPGVSLSDRLGSFASLLAYDQLGVGLSDPAPLDATPTIEERVEELHAVVVAADVDELVLFGPGPAGPIAMLYAASHPERTRALVLVNTFARIAWAQDYPAGVTSESYERFIAFYDRNWGTGRVMRRMLPDVNVNESLLRILAASERQAASPAAICAIVRHTFATDIRSILPTVTAPALVLHTVRNSTYPVEWGRYLAHHLPDARFVELPGADSLVHLPESAAYPMLLDELAEFVTGTRTSADQDRLLTSLLFTDVVGSTERLAAMGDRAWRTVLGRHDDLIRRQLERFAGTQWRFTGDGVLATFDGPARAIRCGASIRDAARQIGLEVRVGIHTGEVERRGTQLAGIAVHLAYRVCESADAGEVLVSRTVVDLVAGSGIRFTDRGDHQLKGIPTPWQLYAVAN